jgi:tRNA A58 N-methylase Trm61
VCGRVEVVSCQRIELAGEEQCRTLHSTEIRRFLDAEGFVEVETFEVLLSSWHVTPKSVRPDHRMVAHTGFVTVARRAA